MICAARRCTFRIALIMELPRLVYPEPGMNHAEHPYSICGTIMLCILVVAHRPMMPKRDRTRENFAKATYRVMRRCDQYSRRYMADYCSTNDNCFPTRIDMDKINPLPIRRTPKVFKENGTLPKQADV
ncbi:hypothetical protein HC256_004377 [Beauveria bassiana]|nr:hypothetical protein HC256_004377 [Beauveria bassiana]